ncbi:MAG TPA: hypothetical protein ENK57_05920 [Polyangiaceae bacterium]|nr:hypothetical protein [Polyangiaceae bacterium]
MIGLGLRAATARRRIDAEHRYRISAQLAYTHESDHPSGTSDVAASLRPFVGLDDFSSFEHVRLGAHYEHWFQDRVWFSFGGALRAYPPPINPGGGREQRLAFEIELRGRLAIHGALSVFAAFYAEGIGHELDPARIGRAALPALMSVVRAELGVSLATESVGRLELYLGVVEEDGRGIDFVRHYGPSLAVGLRASL